MSRTHSAFGYPTQHKGRRDDCPGPDCEPDTDPANRQANTREEWARALAGAATLNGAPAWCDLTGPDRDRYRDQVARILNPTPVNEETDR